MTLDEIKKAAGLGLRVHWASPAYEVRRDSLGQWHIVCTHNGYTVGLTHRDGQTMNGAPEEFFIGGQP